MYPRKNEIIVKTTIWILAHALCCHGSEPHGCTATLTVLSEECKQPLDDVKMYNKLTYDVIRTSVLAHGVYSLTMPCSSPVDVIIMRNGFNPAVLTVPLNKQTQVLMECPGGIGCVVKNVLLYLRSQCGALVWGVTITCDVMVGGITLEQGNVYSFSVCTLPALVSIHQTNGLNTSETLAATENLINLPCVTDSCSGIVPQISDGSFDPDHLTTVGSVVVYQCDPGYRFKSHNNAVCMPDRTWSESPECIQDCGPIPAIENSAVVDWSSSYVIYECNPGYKMEGSELITCRRTGQWSDLPSCTVIFSCDIPSVENAIAGVTNLSVTFTCFPNYQYNDVYTLQCDTVTETLVGDVPVCSRKFSSCPDYFFSYSGNCLLLGNVTEDKSVTHSQAETECSDVGADLVAIDGPEMMAFLVDYLTDTPEDTYWLNLEYVVSSWQWTSSIYTDPSPTYFNWAPGQPDGAGAELCVYMDIDGTWHDATCGTTHDFICHMSSLNGV